MVNNKNKRDKKYYRKAVLQIGLPLFGIFAVALAGLSILIYNGSMKIYLEGKNEIITQHLVKMADTLDDMYHLPWALEYWRAHPQAIKDSHEDDKYYTEDGEGLCPAAYDPYMFTDEELDALSEEDKLEVACILYNSLIFRISEHGHFYDFNSCYIIDISENDRGFIYYEKSYESDAKDIESLGNVWGYPDDEHTAVVKYNKGESRGIEFEIVKNIRFDGRSYYIGYSPIFDRNGNLRYVLALSYDWSDFEKTLKDNMNLMMIIGIGLGLITACLIMLFVYSIVVKPLGIVSKSVETYTDNKNSSMVTNTLSAIKSRNEVGLLAKNISTMTEEIDRYTKEITALATEKERVKAELELAADIQASMLPQNFPKDENYEMYATMDPAKEVGGDFFDFFSIDDKHLGIVIADVSGKGIPAALFMAMSKMNIRNSAGPHISPAQTLALANKAIVSDNENEMFVTVWFGIINTTTGHVRAASAGHEYPIIRKTDGSFEVLKDKHSPVLGALPELKTHDYDFYLSEGDTLFVYTDGAPEASDKDNNMFGLDRLVATLNKDPDRGPKELISAVKSSISEFVGEADQFDDLTLLCFKYKGKSG